MQCRACGHKNLNENAPFCGGCGKPLKTDTAIAERPASTGGSAQGEAAARRRSRALVLAGALCLLAGAVALVIWHYSRGSGEGKIASRPASSAPAAPTASASASAASQPSVRAQSIPQVAPAASTPPGANIAQLDYGGEIESVTGSYGPGHKGRLLIDGSADTVWTPEQDTSYPEEIVLSFYKREAALVTAVVFSFPQDASAGRPKEVEIWTSSANAPTDPFTLVVKATLDDTAPTQAIAFPAVESRFLKIRLLSGADPAALAVSELAVIEGSTAQYVPLSIRYPEIKDWKKTVRFAAQKGIDWLEPATIDWQKKNNCFGCHVQGQMLMGLAVAKANGYVVSDTCMREIADFTRAKQRDDGTEDFDDTATVSPTQYVAMGLAYYAQAEGSDLTKDAAFVKSASWLLGQQKPSGALTPDWDEPPISQGLFMPTANGVSAFKAAFASSSDARYDAAANSALNFIAQSKPETTQDAVYKLIALAEFGTPEQRQLIPSLVHALLSEQLRDGGWRESTDQQGSNAFATGEVLYALKRAGVNVTSPEFSAGVRYLMQSQQEPGTWSATNSRSSRPSEFAPTMWAVISLAGSYGEVEEPTAESIKSQLDKSGRAVLYINFDFNKATIRPDAKPIIAQVLKLMNDNPDLSLEVNGHTDNVGSHDYNVKLSQLRAAAVVSTLVAEHIAPGRLSSGGFGPDQPIDDNSTEKGRAKNRRVELVKR